MKIISTVQATKKRTMAESGSIKTPTLSHVSAVGIQLTDEAKGPVPRSGAATALTKTIMAPSQDKSTDPIARLWLSDLLRWVNNIMRKKASAGGSGINQINISIVMKPPEREA